MKTDIHPEYVESHVRCTCGNEFNTRSTQAEIHVEICSDCHPFYTGRSGSSTPAGASSASAPAAKRGAERQARPPALSLRRGRRSTSLSGRSDTHRAAPPPPSRATRP